MHVDVDKLNWNGCFREYEIKFRLFFLQQLITEHSIHVQIAWLNKRNVNLFSFHYFIVGVLNSLNLFLPLNSLDNEGKRKWIFLKVLKNDCNFVVNFYFDSVSFQYEAINGFCSATKEYCPPGPRKVTFFISTPTV